MKRILTVCLMIFTIILSTIPIAQAANNEAPLVLTVMMKNNQVPVDFAAYVHKNGGKVVKELPRIGMVQVKGPAGLIPILQKYPDVDSVGPGVKMKLSDTKTVIATDVETSSVNDINQQKNDFFSKYQNIMPYEVRNILSNTQPNLTRPPHDPPPQEIGDLFKSLQWDVKRVTHNGASFSVNKGNHDVVVGIIDSGVDSQHPALNANFLGGKNFVPAYDGGVEQNDPSELGELDDYEDRLGHGTHVAGTIAGNGRIFGVAPEIGYKVYRVFGKDGSANTSTVAKAIIAAADDGVDVISMSIGGYSIFGQIFYTDPITGKKYNLGNEVADFKLYKRALKYAVDHGVTVVAAAGNEHLNVTNKAEVTKFLNKEYAKEGYQFVGAGFEAPGSLPGVITVSATGPVDMLASYSNYGPGFVDVTAPGGDYQREGADNYYEDMSFSSYLNQGYAYMAGTSMATPKVSAVAALLIAQNGKVGPNKIAQLVSSTAQDIGKTSKDEFFGNGMVQAPFNPENLSPELDWHKEFGGTHAEIGKDVQQTKDGGYILVGNTESYNHFNGDSDIFVVKTGKDGRTEWRQTLGSVKWELGQKVLQTKDGGYLVIGDTGMNDTSESTNIYVCKLSANGSLEWEKIFGKQGDYENSGTVVETSDGGYLISANKYHEELNNKIWLIKIDNNGNQVWEKSYSASANLFSKIIKGTSDGGYIIAGTMINENIEQSFDFYLLKLKADGKVQWEKSFGNGGRIRDQLEDIVETTKGEFMVVGTNESFGYLQPDDYYPTIKDDIYYALIGENGSVRWEKTIKEGFSQTVKSLVMTPDGNYLAVGYTETASNLNDLLVFKFTPTGNLLWKKTYGGDNFDYGMSIDSTKDGGYIVVGYTSTNATGGRNDYDINLLKFNSLLEK